MRIATLQTLVLVLPNMFSTYFGLQEVDIERVLPSLYEKELATPPPSARILRSYRARSGWALFAPRR